MLKLSANILNKPVLSLRTGGVIATATRPLINPDNLKIEGFYCDDRFSKAELILLTQDIREALSKGLVVNDHNVLAEPEDLVRLKQVLEIDFEVIGKQVVTLDKQKVGKVHDYAVETSTMYIQKLYVTQSLMRSLTGGSLSIDRSLVHETTPSRIIITELSSKAPLPASAAIS